MNPGSKIYVAGHTGMVGSAITRQLKEKGYANIIGRTIEELDLTNQQSVSGFFEKEKPEYVILAAAKVGGIMANNTYRAQFLYENLMIEANIIHQAYLYGVKKLLFLGSSCIYPKNAPQPLREEYLLTSELEQTNEPYAIAKIAGIKLCESYYRQYGCNFISAMPTNLYGPNDNYNLETSHVLPALIRKMHLGKCLETRDWTALRADLTKRPIEGITGTSTQVDILQILKKYGITPSPHHPVTLSPTHKGADPVTVTLWGTGQVFREFMHVDDMATACVKIMEDINLEDLITLHNSRLTTHDSRFTTHDSPPTFLNIGTGIDQSIAEIAEMVKKVVGFRGIIKWDSTKPDGTYKKLMDVSKLRDIGFSNARSLESGTESVYNQYLDRGI
jgi:GDP-L-fucose synthase